jgi:uncharacterized protein
LETIISLQQEGYMIFESAFYSKYDHHRILVEKEGETLLASPQQLEQLIGITYLPQLVFLRESDFDTICGKVEKFRKKEWFDPNQIWLGAYFRKEIQTSVLPPVRLRWIDSTLGWGVFAEQDLKPMTYIGEYSGLIRKRTRSDDKNAYCFQYSIINGESTAYNIDAFDRGGLVRFINHSSKPNLKSALANSESLTHVVLFVSRPVRKGEQLCYDYGPDYWKKRKPPAEL